jgi:hypothetical protein
MPTSRFVFTVPPRHHFVTLLLTAALGLCLSTWADAQVVVRAYAIATAGDGSNFPTATAQMNNGAVTTFSGSGGSAVAGPAGPGATRAEALAEQFGVWRSGAANQSGVTTRADLATGRHIGAVLNTPVDFFNVPGGYSDSWLEDVLHFANTTGAPVDLAVSWTVNGLVTPPSAPAVPLYSIAANMRLVSIGAASPRLRGSNFAHNQVELHKSEATARQYRDSNSGSVFAPGAGPIWNITPIGDVGARMEGTLVLPVGVSSLRVLNQLVLRCSAGTSCDFSLTGAQMGFGALPPGVAMASESGAFFGAPRPSPTPSGLTVQSIVGNQVTLRWAPPTSAVPTGYVMQGGIAPGQTLASLPTGSTATTFTFNAPTGIFYLRMLAQTASGTSAPTNEVTAYVNVPAPPTAPAHLLGLASGAQLGLSWRNTSGGGTPTGMFLDVSGAIAATLPLPVAETFAFNGVPPGTYTFALRATNPSGTSAPSAPITLTFPSACTGTPQAPANLQVTKTGNQLVISWDPPTSGAAISNYVLTVSGALSLAIPLSTRTIGGAVPAGSYTFSVSAVNPCGTGVATGPQTITVP